MKRLLIFFCVLMVATSFFASTPYKNLYVTAQVYPSGAGEVYLTANESDKPYIKEETGEWGDSVMLKYTCSQIARQEEYVSAPGYCVDATDSCGMYEAAIMVRPKEDMSLSAWLLKCKPSANPVL